MARTWLELASLGRLAVLGGCAGLLVGIMLVSSRAPAADDRAATSVMALLSVAGIAMTATLAHVAGRLTDNRRIGWASVLIASYGVMVVPEVLGITLTGDPRSIADLILAVPTLLLVVLGLLLGLAVALTGILKHNPTLFRIGSALVVIAVAHGYDLCVTALPSHNLVFALIRVAGVLALLAAIVTGTHQALLDVDLEQSEQQEELRLAQLDLRQAAERDHEMRNAVAGLAGAATLFDTRPPADEVATLRTAMVAELARLDVLLAGLARPEPELTVCRIRPVLCQQVALRRCAGMEIGLQTELGLGAVGSATLLAQVLTNVLSNCAAHAAASPVWIDARRDGDHIQILISDLGPGIAVEQEDDIFESGVRGGRSTGHGLGLHISRRLLAEVGGTITIRPRSVDQPGCTVELRLAAAEAAERTGELVALRRAS